LVPNDDARRIFLGADVLEDVALRRREAGTAVLLRPRIDQPALLPERLLPTHIVVADQVLAVLHLVAHVGRQIGPDKARLRRRISVLQA
jgi:hypothetical protein